MPASRSPEAAILAAIRAIPAGEVAGYGQIAQRAGLPGRARLVARVLARGDHPDLPWHRVLRADGKIAFPPGSDGFIAQRRRLVAEGLAVDERGRVVRPKAPIDRIPIDLDALLWKG